MTDDNENLIDDSEAEEPEASESWTDKRRHIRYRVSFKVFIRLSDGSVVNAQAVDLSMGGIYMEYGAAAEIDREFEIAFDLPFEKEFKRVFAKAKVVRSVVIGSRNTYGLAFIFTHFNDDSESILGKYLELRALQST